MILGGYKVPKVLEVLPFVALFTGGFHFQKVWKFVILGGYKVPKVLEVWGFLKISLGTTHFNTKRDTKNHKDTRTT